MDRCAIFVDAGYLYANAGLLCHGTKERGFLQLNASPFVSRLILTCRGHCDGLKPLRVYWYDAATDAIPTSEHQEIASLPDTKVRLGRLSGGKQKGVDSMIVRDLMTLARERAMATAFLLSGDEDIREGVVAAQDLGVKVVLLGIPAPPGGSSNQAGTLVREADANVTLEKVFLQEFVLKVERPPEVPQPSKRKIESAGPAMPGSPGEVFAKGWLSRATEEEKHRLLARKPRIPTELDLELIREAEKTLGSLRGNKKMKETLRADFWNTISTISA